MERAVRTLQARHRHKQEQRNNLRPVSREGGRSNNVTPTATVYQKVRDGIALVEDTAEYFKGNSAYVEEDETRLRWKVSQPEERDPTTWRTLGSSIQTITQNPSPYPVTGAKPLIQQAENSIIKQLMRDLHDEEFASNYCCGGEVALTCPGATAISPETEQIFSPPVTLRWDARNGPLVGGRMKFPTSVSLSPLIRDCSPSWEHGQVSWKLDAPQFSTDFSPQNVGITAAIQKVMLPMAVRERYAGSNDYCTLERMTVVADLRYLKVFQAPFGKSDSRREMIHCPSHFGFLYVLLPYACHSQGGGLRVFGREGSSVTFDWTPSASAAIQWAAVYAGDAGIIDTPLTQCLAFQSGYRIILAYNLYAAEGVHTGPLSLKSILDPTRHPFYQNIQAIFRNGNFMRKGGTLGFYCVSYYAHSDQKGRRPLLPAALKGIDFVVYNSFHELSRYTGITVHMGAVWARDSYEVFDNAYRRQFGVKPKGQLSRENPRFERVAPFHEMVVAAPDLTGRMGQHWSIDYEWKNKKMRIYWLNEPSNVSKGVAFVNVALNEDNDTIADIEYSRAAILVKIPPAETQQLPGGKIKYLSRNTRMPSTESEIPTPKGKEAMSP